MRRLAATFLGLMLLSGPILAQGTSSSSDPSQGQAKQSTSPLEAEAGAGTTGDVTNGTSGGQASEPPKLKPWPPGFQTRPDHHPFHGPGAIAIRPPAKPRCDLLNAKAARKLCNQNIREKAVD